MSSLIRKDLFSKQGGSNLLHVEQNQGSRCSNRHWHPELSLKLFSKPWFKRTLAFCLPLLLLTAANLLFGPLSGVAFAQDAANKWTPDTGDTCLDAGICGFGVVYVARSSVFLWWASAIAQCAQHHDDEFGGNGDRGCYLDSLGI